MSVMGNKVQGRRGVFCSGANRASLPSAHVVG